ncbi:MULTISPECIES: cytochrome c biogenesis protein CcsA [Hymenobacter]|uniref:Cytochrome C biogenesis protein n=1 Tax=Hymenobacter jejuensis TaxID=2502781 RepID=A0A5B7ZWX8_9BACT|nr:MULTISPECIES: cytochrome c biogenesis protein CcsA [Hymenobacter]MBC6992435.1 cytochrome c biogenesis protein CcsA [Hymenobacter sp. BT491]QDA59624.1 cytochrome C biogenesis protein [Hymenobacter jejuensis]
MLNTFIGDFGHLSIIVAFVAATVAAYSYFMAARNQPLGETDASWLRIARGSFLLHGAAVVSVITCLFIIIHSHRYEYYYAWSHSSNHLPVYYMISCFWEGQEGSFLLWIFWHVCLGLAIMRFNRKWEAPVMAVFAFVQLFLTSMILGVVLLNVKIGSSPFILLRDFLTDLPVFKLNPNFVPKDGTGLNPLLQNYWMVIHPPTLFLGFALTLVPFAFAIAGLWKGELTKWVKPALPWALFGGLVLGVGIMMGAYWAYETLNFGGYWNWDPVENAVYIPWLVLVASVHGMVLWRRSKTALRTSFVLVITTFLLVLYATFLTRSGVLGNASVHSFTDLGLSGQLIVYLAAFVVLAIGLLWYRWKEIPITDKELTTYNSELWVFVGATVLCLGAFQVLVTTSIPVYNAFLGFVGIKSNLALPADQIAHYTKFQLWMGVLIALLSGIAQVMWWQKNDKESLTNSLTVPGILTLLGASLIILLVRYNKLQISPVYIVVLTAGLFGVLANLSMVLTLVKRKVSLSGGGVAHIGIALMLLGILASAGYSNIISKNSSGLLYSREFTEEINRDNVLLWRNESAPMDGYDVSYTGQYFEVPGLPEYVNKEVLFRTDDEYKALARADIKQGDKVYYKAGDTLNILPENTYYRVEYKDKKTGEAFVLYPRAQANEEMGGLLASPDIKKFLTHDIYSHIAATPDPNKEKDWSEVKEHVLSVGDTLFVNDYFGVFRGVEPAHETAGLGLKKGDLAIQADFMVYGEKKQYHVHPVFVVRNRLIGRVPDEVEDIGLRLSFVNVDPTKGKFTFGVSTTQKDYIILKAMQKPFINLLWSGTLLMAVGFGMAIVRRRREARETVAAIPEPATARRPRALRQPEKVA